MKKLAGWIKTPQGLTLVGVAALALVLWFEGPLVAFSGSVPLETDRSRWIAVACLLLAWALGWFVHWLLARLVNLRFVSGVAAQNSAATTDDSGALAASRAASAEVALLRQRFEQALAVLRKARMKGSFGSQWLYQLPWYMFIGAPGTGKTTALQHSGLRFPLRDTLGQDAIGGVGGTRHCDWWFTDEAVLVDTAGRYTTQDSDAHADQSAWNGFLSLLRKYRPRCPLNGIIVTLSAADLVQQDDAARAAHVRLIRARLSELAERLGTRFPVYLVVTKCDLLAGFTEFFDDLGQHEREQVWGITFPLDETGRPEQALGAFPAGFDALGERLQARVLARMQRESDVRRRALIYGFPQQFAGLQPALRSFLDDTFGGTRYDAPPMLRGVYFTSGTQQGRPIDRAIGALAQSLGLRHDVSVNQGAAGRAYFIKRLMKDVIFSEAALAGANARLERLRAWLQRGALGVIGIVLALALAGLAISYQRNRAYVAEFNQQMTRLQGLAHSADAQRDPLALLPLLDAARDLPGGYADAGKPVPLLTRLWLYQGDKLGAQAQVTYRRLLNETLLPLVVQRLEAQLRRGAANPQEYQYEALRTYLMLGDPQHYDANTVRAWVDLDWQRDVLHGASAVQRNALDGHLAALFDKRRFDPSLPLDRHLIEQARASLGELPLEERLSNRVQRDLEQANLTPFSVSAAAGPNAPLLLTRTSGAPLTGGVPGAYTRSGYARFVQLREAALADVARDAWVLGRQEVPPTPAGTDALRGALTQRYFDAYDHAWDSLLADLSVVPFASLADGARIANQLAAHDSPLRNLIVAAARETTLADVGVQGPAIGQRVHDAATGAASSAIVGNNGKDGADGASGTTLAGAFDAARKRLGAALGNASDTQPAGSASQASLPTPVDAHFQTLHELAGKAAAAANGDTAAADNASLDQAVAPLKDAAVYLEAADAARRLGQPAPAGDALSKLKLAGQTQPAPLTGIAATLSAAGGDLLQGGERARLNALWTSSVGQLCHSALDGRYPLVRTSTRDAAADDFGKLFSPGGLIDDFFQKNLANLVDSSTPVWQWRAGAAPLGLSRDVLAQFQRAAQIRDAFFRNGGRDVSIRFGIKPLSLDASLTQLTLDIDGQQLVVTHDALQSAQFQWPSGKNTGRAQLDFTPPAGQRASFDASGPWALLHLVDAGQLETTAQADHFRLTFDSAGRKAVVELDAASVVNPFRRAALEQFSCPTHL
ncbi:type VI secretion system membrane subunit TssM [Paraburkholderia panacisoli]|uniref:Type VI secretion system membrane subunit TssM n=1 Tax=Paraburkholderia panacisoli TaxID=2603818 RepID=A0A5B0GDU0_9BURK|nr:type VI secretion system membrane subunit TssM [Paraburkholderia panacisoli]KAA1000985.1 type VI secretion system membrane subunit TssM [Paraburkholderia panacisoli]